MREICPPKLSCVICLSVHIRTYQLVPQSSLMYNKPRNTRTRNLPTLRKNRTRKCLRVPLIRVLWSISVTNHTPSHTDCTLLSLEMEREAGVDVSCIRRTLMKCRCSLPLTLLFYVAFVKYQTARSTQLDVVTPRCMEE
jgi:hypothetical protein